MRLLHFLPYLALFLVTIVHGAEPTGSLKDHYGDPLPPGAVARFGTGPYRAASTGGFLADGKTIASSSPWATGGHSVALVGCADGKGYP